MTLFNKTMGIGCAAVVASLGPTFITLGIASSICGDVNKSPLENKWILFGTPLLLGYASYVLWTND